jgi:cytoskeleton protein RodZ
MINEVSPATKASDKEQIDSTNRATEPVTELSEDMEMVSPGAMLRDARKTLSFSQEYIANKLNLKPGLVNDIENDKFDPSMPVTFNRGYLANYAKLVSVEVEDVLASYDALGAASLQRSEMLSFSKETSKQAEHSRVMWLSYLIVAVLVGLTILWWQQESSPKEVSSSNAPLSSPSDIAATKPSIEPNLTESIQPLTDNVIEPIEKEAQLDSVVISNQVQANTENLASLKLTDSNATTKTKVSEEAPAEVPTMSTAVFTFKGDCWVNIFDATGERIAWGVKKAGYVMTIQGKAPLRITVGKPELTSIVFNDKTIDMSVFDVGNIAKFNLPIIVE